MHLLGTICRPAFAVGFLPTRHNRQGLLSLAPAFRNALNYPILSLGSKPSTLSDFAQMFKEKEFFCFKRMSRAWQNTVQRNAQISTVQRLVMSSLPPLSSFSTSKKINMGTITLAQGLKKNLGSAQVSGSRVIFLCPFALNPKGW